MRPLVASFLALTFVTVSACSRPEPPTLTPKQVTVNGVSLAGIDMHLQLDAYNPNTFALTARSLTAKIVLDGKYDAGTVTTNTSLTLAPQNTTPLDVPASISWTDLTQIATLASANRPIPYTVDGTATIGGEKLNVDLPFHLTGTLTPEQLRAAAMKSLPFLVPH